MGKYPRRIKYEIGQKYHAFIITGEAPRQVTKTGRTYTCWECMCDCGVKFVTTTKQIQKGVRKSCGCLSKSNRYKKMPSEQVVGGSKYNHYTACAARRGIPWHLTKKDFIDIIFKNCYYCGSKPSLVTKTSVHVAKVNGVDRMDSKGPYSISNCVTCCRQCNCAKGSMPLEDFLAWIERLKKYESSSDIGHTLSST